MPELPEVEITVQGVRPHLVGNKITKVAIHNDKLRLKPTAELEQQVGQEILDVTRIAKYVVIHLSSGYICIHLGMSGNLKALDPSFELLKHDHVEIFLSNDKVLRLNDPRRFGGVAFYPSYEAMYQAHFASNGLDALDPQFNGQYLQAKIGKKKLPIKKLLMDNSVVTGVGNIYANETLYEMGINPFNEPVELTAEQFEQMTVYIKEILRESIKCGGTTLKDFEQPDGKPGYFVQKLRCYGKTGLTCPLTGGVFEEALVGGRNSFFVREKQPFSPAGLKHYQTTQDKLAQKKHQASE